MSILTRSDPRGTIIIGQNPNSLRYDNYFYCDGTNDHTDINSAIAEFNSLTLSGKIFIEAGVYDIQSAITFTGATRYIVEGEGGPRTLTSPTTSGGSILNFSNDSQLTAGTTARITFRDLGFNCSGTYTDTWIDLIDNNLVHSFNCYYRNGATVPSGSSTIPYNTAAGCGILIGKTSGPPGDPYLWDKNIFFDSRRGANSNNTFFVIKHESLQFSNNMWYLELQTGPTSFNMMFVEPVSYRHHINNTMFPDEPASGNTYEHQYMCNGGNKNYYMVNNQLLDTTGLTGTGAHFTHHGAGTLHIYGYNFKKGEGGTSPVLPSGAFTNNGRIRFRLSGRGWETEGSSTIPNGTATTGNIAHGLIGTPTVVHFTGTTSDTEDIYASTVDATNIAGSVVGNVGGDRTVYYSAKYTLDIN